MPATGSGPAAVETAITSSMVSISDPGLTSAAPAVEPPREPALLLGASWCGWTQRQVDELDGMPNVEVVMCDKTEDARCEHATAYPTWVVDGEAHPGFVPRADLPALIGA